MANPFKPDDKVLILRKGLEIEATVRSTWNHEVQVRTADGDLLWRTVKTIRGVIPPDTPASENQTPMSEVLAEATPGETSPEDLPQAPDTPDVAEAVPANVEPEPTEPDSVPADQPAEPVQQHSGEAPPKPRKRRKGILSKFIFDDNFDQ